MGRKPKSAEVRARFFTARASGATLREAAAAVPLRGPSAARLKCSYGWLS
jgi:hypothetical protein